MKACVRSVPGAGSGGSQTTISWYHSYMHQLCRFVSPSSCIWQAKVAKAAARLDSLSPAVRLGLSKRVSAGTRDKVFAAAVLTALLHAGYIMSGDSTMGAGN